MKRANRWMVVAALLWAAPSPAAEREPVVLIHGLGRTSNSMRWFARRLEESGFRTIFFEYPSREETLERLAERLDPVIRAAAAGGSPVHAVTHSMGGVVLRIYVERHPEARIGRVVMLAPPSAGSELADRLASSAFGRRILGPAGGALGTSDDSIVRRLGPVGFELGVIAGRSSLNPWFSTWIPGPDDGKVAVARTVVPGMKGFVAVPCSHTWIMFDEEVIRRTIRFLQNGSWGVPPQGSLSPLPSGLAGGRR